MGHGYPSEVSKPDHRIDWEALWAVAGLVVLVCMGFWLLGCAIEAQPVPGPHRPAVLQPVPECHCDRCEGAPVEDMLLRTK